MTSFKDIGNDIINLYSKLSPKNIIDVNEDIENSVTPQNTTEKFKETLSHNTQSGNATGATSSALALSSNKLADYIEIDPDDLETYESCGRGSYGSVYRGMWKSRNKIVAIKKLLQLENEAEILSMCSHRNIIQFYGIMSKASNYSIITEYAEYGSLHNFIRDHDLYEEFGLGLILQWAHDIALGMNYLHYEAPVKIIHRDLKSNNVLIKATDDTLVCKICDFGSSRFGYQTIKMTVTGTFPWMSPEIIQSKPANNSADVWSYGVVLWELITGEVPFKGIDEFQIAFLVVERDYRLPIPSGCPQVLASLMQECWQNDPKLRPSFKSILSTLDQIDLDENTKTQIDISFTKNKSKWVMEIEQAFERLKKIEDDLHMKEKLLEARERRLREMEIELITTNTKLLSFEEHDINSWSENDVYDWVKRIGLKFPGIGAYCEKFLNHNINGKRLLMMKKSDLRNIGILSEGHIIDIFHEIETVKLENIRLLNFPPLKQTAQFKSQFSLRNVSYNLLIGSHIINQQKPEDTKWKMFIDIDECDDSRDVHVISCIRDVKFVCRTNQLEQFNVNKSPFVMRRWIRGLIEDKRVTCIITYEDKVVSPRKTTIEYELDCTNPTPFTQMVYVSVEKADNSSLNTTTMSNTSSNASTSTATNAIALITANINFQSAKGLSPSHSSILNGSTENVWKKRNLENSISIPVETQAKNSSDLWSGIVAGRYRTSESETEHETVKRVVSESLAKNSQVGRIVRSQTLVQVSNALSSVNKNKNQTVRRNPILSKVIARKDGSTGSNKSGCTAAGYGKMPNAVENNPKTLTRNLSGYGRGKSVVNTNSYNSKTKLRGDSVNIDGTYSSASKSQKPFFY